MAVSKRNKAIYNMIFDNFELFFANKISNYLEHKYLRKYLTKDPIPKDFKKQYKLYWSKYFKGMQLKRGLKYAWYYASQNGIFDVRYLPNDLYYTKIDQYFNQRKLGWGFNDKNYYSLIFKDIKQPTTLVRKIGDTLLDENYNMLTIEESIAIVCNEEEVICKPTLETGSGRNIAFFMTKKDYGKIKSILSDDNEKDFIIQSLIRQHEKLSKIHDKSINTIRICSILLDDGVHILSSCLRMGVDNSRIDNVTAGGISVGIKQDGTLKKYAYSYYSGEKYEVHPQGIKFENYLVPSYDKACDLVMNIHPKIPHFRLVSWDITIDTNGDPVLIEANMRKGGLNLQQFSNGPLFGDLTDMILDDVFNKKQKNNYNK